MRVLCLVLLSLAVGALPAFGQDDDPVGATGDPAPKRQTVGSIRFSGNKRYTDEFLKEQIASKEGEPYDRGLLDRDEKHLRNFF
ncbi:MAG: POTRA domain-containing protein, partial [Planctomycetota bacterium]